MFSLRAHHIGKHDYNQNAKRSDANKLAYHQTVANYVKDIQAYNAACKYTEPLEVLTLESTDLASARMLVDECGIPLQHIDMVSRNVRFEKVRKNTKTGDLYTGELYDYLTRIRPLGGYDVCIFDFCGVWANQKECVKRLFDMKLLDECAFLTITCCSRNNTSDKSEYQGHDYDKCEDDVHEWAKDNGYRVADHHPRYVYKNMFCLFFKVIHCKRTMSYAGGVQCEQTAADWLRAPVDVVMPSTRSFNKKTEMKKKQMLKLKTTVGKMRKRRI